MGYHAAYDYVEHWMRGDTINFSQLRASLLMLADFFDAKR